MKNYSSFISESNNQDEISIFLDQIAELPTKDILKLRDGIEEMIKKEDMNESIASYLGDLKRKLGAWFDDRLFNFLINRKKKFYLNLVDKLNIFDVTSLDDVVSAFPGFKVKSMYLAGGMDDAEDTGAGWRHVLEREFELENPGKNNDKVLPIDIGDDKVENPSYVVDGEFLDMILADPSKLDDYYDRPALFNPVRKEVDRNKDNQFEDAVKALKDPNYDPDESPEAIRFFQKTFSENIEPDDEHLLRICSAVFLGYDKTAGAGTYGELELLSLIRKPLFVWLVNGYDNKPGTFKLWNIPHISKVARTKEDMITLVKTILKYTK